MDFKIIEREGFTIVGKGIKVSTKEGENFQKIPQFWQESMDNGLFQRLLSLMTPQNEVGEAMIGACIGSCPKEDFFTYFIGVQKPEKGNTDELEEQEIPKASYAVFEAKGPLPSSIQGVWDRIYGEWYPTADYAHANAPDLEIYPPGPQNEDYRCEVWIPVVKK